MPDKTLPAALRSALYLPASNQRAIEKSRGIDCDVIVFDLEDAVAEQSKFAARAQLIEAFAAGDFGRSRTAIRFNAIGGQHFTQDLLLLADISPDIVLLPKVSGPEDVSRAALAFASIDKDKLPKFWFMIETASGLLNVRDTVETAVRESLILEALVVGSNDIAKETGVAISDNRKYLLPWLMHIVLVARANGLAVLDGVWNRFRDQQGFIAEADQGARMGFDGKTLIHPSQVDYANQAFSPSAEQLAHARRVISEFSRPENQHANVINIDGEMVERLHLEQAQRLMQRVVE